MSGHGTRSGAPASRPPRGPQPARCTWGGARAGAGRPSRGPIASEPHKTRPHLASQHPVHVTARVRPDKLRRDRARVYRALHRALALSFARDNFRIVHLALHRDRVELVIEADDKAALARGMQGFQVSAAKALNRMLRRRGNVFPDRYRMRILRTRVAVRSVIGAAPLTRTPAWPQTWLLRIELHRIEPVRWYVATAPPELASDGRVRRRRRIRRRRRRHRLGVRRGAVGRLEGRDRAQPSLTATRAPLRVR